jgi:2-phospho-L-lactate guanylyltransferase (CobY/MobA/RfbA family)
MTASSPALEPASIPTVILAGGKAKPDMLALTGQTNRALATVNGKTLLRHVVDAILTADIEGGPLGPITVIGDLPDDAAYFRLPDSGDFVSNIMAGLNAYRDAPYVLVSTADLPFLTGAAVQTFVHDAYQLAERSGAGLIYPIVPLSVCYACFPGIRRTALRLRDGEFTGGNLVLVRPQFLLSHSARIATAYAARKSPVQLARMLGLGTLGRVVVSQKVSPKLLSVSFLETRVSALLGGPCRALSCESAAIATDLDRPSDFEAIAMMQAAGATGRSPLQ